MNLLVHVAFKFGWYTSPLKICTRILNKSNSRDILHHTCVCWSGEFLFDPVARGMHCHASPIDSFRGQLTLTFSCPQGAFHALDVINNFDSELVDKNVVLIAYNISQEGGMRDGETRRPEGPGFRV